MTRTPRPAAGLLPVRSPDDRPPRPPADGRPPRPTRPAPGRPAPGASDAPAPRRVPAALPRGAAPAAERCPETLRPEIIRPEIRPWDEDPFAEAVRTGRGPLWLRCQDTGHRHPLDVAKWCAPADRADLTLVHRCARARGPVLDIGCGPGRLTAELLAHGVPALGVDVTRAAVARTRSLGAAALCRSVFDLLPGEGRWPAALLADGNVGIGGDPEALLRRCAELLRPGGLLLAEVAWAPLDQRSTVRVEDARGRLGPPFRWARVGAPAARRCARAAGFAAVEEWTAGGRRFLALVRQHTTAAGTPPVRVRARSRTAGGAQPDRR